ncbi:MAG TPA: hypothetical protein VID76_00125 [Solirubrobacterales bacterium]|jgi:hypothetical protein
MRKAVNENPLVQAAIIGVLALLVGVMLLLRMGGSSDSAETAATDPAAATASDPAAATATDPAAASPAGAASADPASGAASSGSSAPAPVPGAETTAFKAGPGLPKEVADAYDQGKAVVLLVVDKDGIDDQELEVMVDELRSHPDAAVFVTEVDDASRYSRITEGVDLDRTPALVVVQPKSLTDGPMPTAVVSYGFRGAGSVRQALKDALYKGPQDLPYYPK